MEAIFQDFLFEKRYLVHNPAFPTDKANDVVLSLATLFAIRVVEGYEFADTEMIATCEKGLGFRVPLPFYRSFPQSVRALSPDQLLFDQLLHYVVTYGFGYFDEAGHSVFEEYLERAALKEKVSVTDYRIVDEAGAEALLKETVCDMLASTRPLNEASFAIVKAYYLRYGLPAEIASKHTAIRLLIECRDLSFARYLALSDVLKVASEINYLSYNNEDLTDLNLKNRDRKLIAGVLDTILDGGICNIRECYEKKALWCGLLHHIHYQPKTEKGRAFVTAMRSKGNKSVYAAFEKAVLAGEIRSAAALLKEGKGSGALLRNLHYLISRATSEEEIDAILAMIDTDNVMILLQLLVRYHTYRDEEHRIFHFTRFNRFVVYRETDKEARRRKTLLSECEVARLLGFVEGRLAALLKNRVGKVYLDPAMKKIALPLQENTSMGGVGVLPRGSRLAIGEGNKLRAFTYWEQVDDIDLAVIGIDSEGSQHEYSWRTMAGKQSDMLAFSGDETSGYFGGSEYYDIDLDLFREKNPTIETLVFTANVYSGRPFSESVCRAGYMIRKDLESGEIYEPKTVKSAFTVNCNSTMAYLFALDLKTRELVWLNIAKESEAIVAGSEAFGHLLPYFGVTDAINWYSFFELMAETVVDAPDEADIVLSDAELDLKEGVVQIRSYEYEKLFKYIN